MHFSRQVRQRLEKLLYSKNCKPTFYRQMTSTREAELAESLREVHQKISTAVAESITQKSPLLVAVSKLKPVSDILGCYQAGQRHFGENYVNELVEKSGQLPQDIQWHFIGTLQSNKVKALTSIPNLEVIQTLTSAATTTALNRLLPDTRTTPLNVMLQVNTSGEDSKSGLSPLQPGSQPSSNELPQLATHVITNCPRLHLLGIMTIGSFESSTDPDKPNPDFERLIATRDELEQHLQQVTPEGVIWGRGGTLLMSFGMSSDFEAAIKAGSDIIRVGTSIFGERPPRAT